MPNETSRNIFLRASAYEINADVEILCFTMYRGSQTFWTRWKSKKKLSTKFR